MKSRFINKDLLLGTTIIVAPLCNLIVTGIYQNDMSLFPVLIICLLILSFRLILFLKSNKQIKGVHLTASDIAIAIFISYVFLRWVSQRGNITELAIFRWFFFATVYILARMVKYKKTLFSALVLSASLQAVITLLQKAGCLSSYHPLFDVTGTFNNPGPLGGYLAMGLAVAIPLYTPSFRHWSMQTFWKVIATSSIGIAFYLADSRAGLLAVTTGLLTAYGREIKNAVCQGRTWIIYLSITAATFVCICLFAYRPLSANGRLLIWQISSNMVTNEPLWGHGIGAFEKEYMFYQADYFNKYPQSTFLNVADNVTYPYNELLHIAVEMGICGLILFLMIVTPLFTFPNEKIAKGALATWLMFAMFSYPVNVVPLMMNFALFTGLCRSRTVLQININKYWGRISIISLIGLLALCTHTMLIFNNKNKLLINTLGNRNKNVEQANLLRRLPPTCETYCMLGDIYLELNDYKQAKEYYTTAASMVPTRIRPNYKLWNLYLLQQDTVNARKTAQHILTQPIKVENTFSIKVKKKMKQFLNEIDK